MGRSSATLQTPHPISTSAASTPQPPDELATSTPSQHRRTASSSPRARDSHPHHSSPTAATASHNTQTQTSHDGNHSRAGNASSIAQPDAAQTAPDERLPSRAADTTSAQHTLLRRSSGRHRHSSDEGQLAVALVDAGIGDITATARSDDESASFARLRALCTVDPVEAQLAATAALLRERAAHDGVLAPPRIDWNRAAWHHPLLQRLALLSPLSSHDMCIPSGALVTQEPPSELAAHTTTANPVASIAAPQGDLERIPVGGQQMPALVRGSQPSPSGPLSIHAALTSAEARLSDHAMALPYAPMALYAPSDGAPPADRRHAAPGQSPAERHPTAVGSSYFGHTLTWSEPRDVTNAIEARRAAAMSPQRQRQPPIATAAAVVAVEGSDTAIRPAATTTARDASSSCVNEENEKARDDTGHDNVPSAPVASTTVDRSTNGAQPPPLTAKQRFQRWLNEPRRDDLFDDHRHAATTTTCPSATGQGAVADNVVALEPLKALLRLSSHTLAGDVELQRLVGTLATVYKESDPETHRRLVAGDFGEVDPLLRDRDSNNRRVPLSVASPQKANGDSNPNRGFLASDIVAFPTTTVDSRRGEDKSTSDAHTLPDAATRGAEGGGDAMAGRYQRSMHWAEGYETYMQRRVDVGHHDDEEFLDYKETVSTLEGRVEALTRRAWLYGMASSVEDAQRMIIVSTQPH